jgi:ankyrin repeat protein
MHLVVQSSNLALLKIVAEFEPDYKVANSMGDTPLHIAILNNDAKISKMLINLGGEELTTIRNKAGQVPAQLAKDPRFKNQLQDAGTSSIGSSSFNGSLAPRFR